MSTTANVSKKASARPERATTTRTRKQPGPQPPLDVKRIDTYHHHGCISNAPSAALPFRQKIGRAVALPAIVVRLSSQIPKAATIHPPNGHRHRQRREHEPRSSPTPSLNKGQIVRQVDAVCTQARKCRGRSPIRTPTTRGNAAVIRITFDPLEQIPGAVGYCCPSESSGAYVRKVGGAADTIGRRCL